MHSRAGGAAGASSLAPNSEVVKHAASTASWWASTAWCAPRNKQMHFAYAAHCRAHRLGDSRTLQSPRLALQACNTF
jgi:hypothetical protein